MDWTAFISSIGGATSSIIKSTETPSVIPGTTAVYNPATGQVINTAGFGGGISITMILLIVGAIFLFRKA